MPTVSQFFQPPLYWQQFEDLALGMLREVYDIPNAQQYGRPGQAQNGVDVFGRSKRYGTIGIQCKRLADLDPKGDPYPGGPISRKFLRETAEQALSFKHDLKLWILATTARRDTAVQGWVNEINQEWEDKGLDRLVIVWTWDECIAHLNTFPHLQRWYYETVIEVRGAKDLDEVILRTIAMAFSRPAFEVPLDCESPDDFRQALEDTQRAIRTGELLDRRSRQPIRKAIGGWRELDDPEVREGIRHVAQLLRKLRAELERGRKDQTIRDVGGYLDFADPALARSLDDLRDRSVKTLNDVLELAGLPSI